MDQSQRWLVQPLQYTEEMNKRGEDGEDQTLAEEAIAAQLFYYFLESSIMGHARYAYDCLREHFPCLPGESLQVQPTAVVSALADCLYRWHDSVADNIHPSEAEATEVSQQLAGGPRADRAC